MPQLLPDLEQQRSAILRQIVALPDFRSGSITTTSGPCGKPNCHCHQPNQPGHGPNFRLTRKVSGKTVTETFSTPAELRKAQREVETYHRFRELSQQLLELNEKICRARPIEDSLTPQEKKRPKRSISKSRKEVTRFLQVIFHGVHASGHLELAAIEMLIRSAMHQAGAAALTRLLQFAPPDAEHRTVPCPCGQSAQYQELRSKSVLTVVGPAQLRRPYYLCPRCHTGQFPVDVQLGVAAMESSPGVRRMEAVVGSQAPFDQGREQMKLLADLEVTTKAIERSAEAIGADIAVREQQEIARAKQLVLPIVSRQSIPILYVVIDATGVPVVTKETEGRIGKIQGQRAHTRECKLGCVFTQTKVDAEGRPIRDPNSTTYTGAIETAEEFGFRIYTEAWRRGWEWAKHKVVIGDGAVWIWNIADRHFPGALQIVDLYHARQHLWNVAAMLYPYDPVAKNRWMLPMQHLLDNGKIELLIERLQETAAGHASLSEIIRKEADYFSTNANRMRYPEFRTQGLFIGSGVIEAGCKTVIGERLKRSGMFWTVRGANAIIALRCCRFNRRFEDHCEEARIA